MAEEKIKGQGPIDLVSDIDKKRLDKQEEIRDRKKRDKISLLKIAAFRRFLLELIQSTGAHGKVFVPGDSHATAFYAGKQELGNELILEFMSADPEAYIQMGREAMAQKIQDEKEVNQGD